MDNHEDFNITDRDCEFALNPLEFCKNNRSSKHDAIYGIWADNSPSSEDEFSYTKKSKKSKISAASNPISFISSGVNEMKEKNIEMDGVEIIEDSDDSDDLRSNCQKRKSDEGDLQKLSKRPKIMSHTPNPLQGFAKWEQNTTGFASKYFQKCGYEPGQGLGKNSQGIVTPIIAGQVKKNKGCIGFADATTNPIKPMTSEDIKEAIRTAPKPSTYGKEMYKTDKQGPKFEFKKLDEIISDSNIDLNKVTRKPTEDAMTKSIKIVDMTTRDTKEYVGYQNMFKQRPEDEDTEYSSQKRRTNLTWEEKHKLAHKEKSFTANSLIKNLNLVLKDSTEQLVMNKKILNEKDEVMSKLENEIKELDKKYGREMRELKEIDSMVDFLDEFEEQMNLYDPNSLEQFALWIKKAHDNSCQLRYPQLIIAVAQPLLALVVRDWRPLQRPFQGVVDYFVMCQEMLDPWVYEALVRVAWLPIVAAVIETDWDPVLASTGSKGDTLLVLLDGWRPHIPQQVTRQLLLGPVLDRLARQLDKWDPRSDPVPVHRWLLPWLEAISTRYQLEPSCISPLLDQVRAKLGRCLASWHPADESAHAVLQPWRTLFPAHHMAALLHTHILPRLASAIRQLKIDPADQDLSPFHWVLRWSDLLATETLVELLAADFFPRWLQVLAVWLNSAQTGPDPARAYKEIGQWYKGWWQQLPSSVVEHPRVADIKQSVLNMMTQSHQGQHVRPPSAAATGHQDLNVAGYRGAPGASSGSSMKQRLEELAYSLGAPFHPVSTGGGVSSSQRQLFWFGEHLQVCSDYNKLYHFSQGNYMEISLAELASLFHSMGAASASSYAAPPPL